MSIVIPFTIRQEFRQKNIFLSEISQQYASPETVQYHGKKSAGVRIMGPLILIRVFDENRCIVEPSIPQRLHRHAIDLAIAVGKG